MSSCIWIEGGGTIPAGFAGRLHAPIYLNALAVQDAERVAAHLKVLSSRLHNLDGANDGALRVLHPEPDHCVGNGLLGQR